MARTKNTTKSAKGKDQPTKNITKSATNQPTSKEEEKQTTKFEKEKPPIPWTKSNAKELLRQDIIDDKVPAHWPAHMVQKMRPEYQEYDLKNFGPNLNTLRDAVRKDYNRMLADCEYYGHDLALLKDKPPKARAYPNWHQSSARLLLKSDTKVGKHKAMKPKELHMTKAEYQEFPLEVFRKHIYQDVDERASRAFRFQKKGKRMTFRETVNHTKYIEQLEEAKANSSTKQTPPTMATRECSSFADQYRAALEASVAKKGGSKRK
jgi:hypothetical protein